MKIGNVRAKLKFPLKKLISLVLIFILGINSFAAIVSDNDGSAFITKAEFDSLKNNFQSQIDSYNQSIDSKIDGAIAAYLAGIKLQTISELDPMNLLLLKNGVGSLGPSNYDLYVPPWQALEVRIIKTGCEAGTGDYVGAFWATYNLPGFPGSGLVIDGSTGTYKELIGYASKIEDSVACELQDNYNGGNYQSQFGDSSSEYIMCYGILNKPGSVTLGSTKLTMIEWMGSSSKSTRSDGEIVTSRTYTKNYTIYNMNQTHNATNDPFYIVTQPQGYDYFVFENKKDYILGYRGTTATDTNSKGVKRIWWNLTTGETWDKTRIDTINSNSTAKGHIYKTNTPTNSWPLTDKNVEKITVARLHSNGETSSGKAQDYGAVAMIGVPYSSVDLKDLFTKQYDAYADKLPDDAIVTVSGVKHMKCNAGLPVVEVKKDAVYTVKFKFASTGTYYIVPSVKPLTADDPASWDLLTVTGLTKVSGQNYYKTTTQANTITFTAPENGYLWLKWSTDTSMGGGGRIIITEQIVEKKE